MPSITTMFTMAGWFAISTSIGSSGPAKFWSSSAGGLISAPLIPAGIRSFLRIPVDSGGMKFGREACYFCHSGALPFRRNLGIPELTPECSAGLTGTEWNGIRFFVCLFYFCYQTTATLPNKCNTLSFPPTTNHIDNSDNDDNATRPTTATTTPATNGDDHGQRRGNETDNDNDNDVAPAPSTSADHHPRAPPSTNGDQRPPLSTSAHHANAAMPRHQPNEAPRHQRWLQPRPPHQPATNNTPRTHQHPQTTPTSAHCHPGVPTTTTINKRRAAPHQ
ncbi:uncharacterized protein LACBIDRAFT_323917 [Laccaria bicolor S238N-H82]|uniref:Predicted protein n=1 Tax=Laccaria bicolor (strain S238N-H82 / ATCC MYA-4686) TaxID=486041 RepID=B0D022_LACBS|nr:uncharacterized protein LACBIDRAFT_323917 [Laccaria bicolor S238N-H82]EDR11753.1 predicted protein [Laccaria bicolor S238N-H82]|eukprot:XP_001877650.1 predicted protein [Laccaria bicolor S238N-H82]